MLDIVPTRLRRLARRAVSEDRGASLVEYSLLLALIALVCVGALMLLGGSTNGDDGAGLSRSKACIAAAYDNTPKPANCP